MTHAGDGSVVLGAGTSDADGRVDRLNAEPLAPGEVALTFDVAGTEPVPEGGELRVRWSP